MSNNWICKKCDKFRIDGKPVWINKKYVWYCKDCYLEKEYNSIDNVSSKRMVRLK